MPGMYQFPRLNALHSKMQVKNSCARIMITKIRDRAICVATISSYANIQTQLLSSLCSLVAYIENNMILDQTAPGFIVFASMIKSSLKCT